MSTGRVASVASYDSTARLFPAHVLSGSVICSVWQGANLDRFEAPDPIGCLMVARMSASLPLRAGAFAI